jgi:hypothetical protein
MEMTDPRTPRTRETQLPDPLDQTPAGERPEDALAPRGSEDAQLFAEAEAGDEDVETADVRTND